MSIPGQTMGVSVFTGSLIDVLKMSRINLSITYMIGTICSSLLLSQAGRFYDRFGARITLFFASCSLGIVLLFLSQIDRIATFLAQNTIASFSLCGFVLMTIGFFLLRFSGQGVMTMVSRSMVMKWFDKRRGMAAAIMGVFTTFGFSYAPKLLDNLIQSSSWRGAWQTLALCCGFCFAVIALIFYRDSPAQCGLKPDSLKPLPYSSNIQKKLSGEDLPLKEAKKRLVLWVFALSLALWSLYNTAFTFHVVSIFKAVGIDRWTALSIFFPISIISIATRFLVSWGSDHVQLEYLYIFFLLSLILASFSLIFLTENSSLIPLIVGMGFAGGTFGTLNSISWVRLFGKAHLGAISGFAMGWTVAGSAIGPYFFSLSKNVFGSYNGGSWFTILLASLSLIGVLYQILKSNTL